MFLLSEGEMRMAQQKLVQCFQVWFVQFEGIFDRLAGEQVC